MNLVFGRGDCNKSIAVISLVGIIKINWQMKILITLDYELFLNDMVGTIDNCLIKPMKYFNNVCANHGVKAVIFVDMAYVFRLKQLSEIDSFAKSEYEKVVSNIIVLKQFGHDIELHLHPQWFYSDLIDKKWVLDWKHYKLSDMPVSDIITYFRECVSLLEDIIDTKVIGFRAGGYSVQDFAEFSRVMCDNKIIIDSSVLPYVKTSKISKLHRYNYLKFAEKALYSFSDDITKEDETGILYELPISTCRDMTIFRYFRSKQMNMRKYRSKNWGDGGDFPLGKIELLYRYLQRISAKMLTVASIDYQSFFNLEYVYNYHVNKGSKYFTIIGHPKNISENSLGYLDKFLSNVKNRDQVITLKDILNTL